MVDLDRRAEEALNRWEAETNIYLDRPLFDLLREYAVWREAEIQKQLLTCVETLK